METVDPTAVEIESDAVNPSTDPLVQRMRGVAVHGNIPFDVPYISRITDRLFQGGADPNLVLPRMFTHWFCLAPWFKYRVHPDHDVIIEEVVMYDSVDGADREQVTEVAGRVLDAVGAGGTVAVTCQAGLNRSGLIAAAALILDGNSPEAAVHLLRAQRSPAVLCNPGFESFLHSFRPA